MGLHEATWLAWPHYREDWPGKFEPISWVYCEIRRKLAQVERVRILVDGEALEWMRGQAAEGRRRIGRGGILSLSDQSRVDARLWSTVRQAATDVALINWLFNGWAKYDDWRLDNAVPWLYLQAAEDAAMEARDWCSKGAVLDVNGAGLLLTTEECLLSDVQARNPGLPRAEIEKALSDYLGGGFCSVAGVGNRG